MDWIVRYVPFCNTVGSLELRLKKLDSMKRKSAQILNTLKSEHLFDAFSAPDGPLEHSFALILAS